MKDNTYTPIKEILRVKRDEYIVKAFKQGIPQSLIASIFNVTQQRVSQLIKEKKLNKA